MSARWWWKTSPRAPTCTQRSERSPAQQRYDDGRQLHTQETIRSPPLQSVDGSAFHGVSGKSSVQVDFDQLQENLCQMERRCKASWDHLKVIAKHEMKPQLKQKMSDFLKDCAERIIILKTVHRRIINRYIRPHTGRFFCSIHKQNPIKEKKAAGVLMDRSVRGEITNRHHSTVDDDDDCVTMMQRSEERKSGCD